MCKLTLLLIMLTQVFCVKQDVCTDCLTPSLQLTFFDAKTNEKVILPLVVAVFNNSDTILNYKSADSTYKVYKGTGTFSIIVNDPRYENVTINNIAVVDDKTVCKRIYTQILEIDLTQKTLQKVKKADAVIRSQRTKLGC